MSAQQALTRAHQIVPQGGKSGEGIHNDIVEKLINPTNSVAFAGKEPSINSRSCSRHGSVVLAISPLRLETQKPSQA